MFADESTFCIDSSDRRQGVYRRRGESFADLGVVETDRWDGQSVIVWAGFTYHHKTQLMFFDFGRGRGPGLTAQHYIDQVFHSIALSFIVALPGTVLQQDNARPHAARLTQNFLTTHNVPTLPWPASSPDLNPIEDIWDYMKRKIRSRNVNNVRNVFFSSANKFQF